MKIHDVLIPQNYRRSFKTTRGSIVDPREDLKDEVEVSERSKELPRS